MADQPLSPAAQAVLDAAFPVYNNDEVLYFVSGEQHTASIAAAALRAVAPMMECVQDHLKLLAIAAELEATTP
jgi:hypothetical protein